MKRIKLEVKYVPSEVIYYFLEGKNISRFEKYYNYATNKAYVDEN